MAPSTSHKSGCLSFFRMASSAKQPAEVDLSSASSSNTLHEQLLAVETTEVQWEWRGDGLCWTAYPRSISSLIEAAFQAGEPTVDFLLSHSNYSIHFRPCDHRQKNLVTNLTRPVKREASTQGTCGSWLWWENEMQAWHAYDDKLAQRIEDAWDQSQTSTTSRPPAGLSFAIRGHPYSIEFETDGVQYNVRTRFARGVHRRWCSSRQLESASNEVSRLQDNSRHGHSSSSSSFAANDNGASSSVQGKDDLEVLSYNPHDLVELENPPENEDCSICLSSLQENAAATLTKCNHSFHRDCIEYWFKSRPTCPECLTVYGTIFGTQPSGEMHVQYITCRDAYLLAGYPNTDVIKITYDFSNGVQRAEHPNPGKPYMGTFRTAYLPKTREGEEVLELLKKAWTRRLLFRIGTSVTTGQNNVVTWAGIHHKTRMSGGSSNHGYPDETYLVRVKKELEDVGVV